MTIEPEADWLLERLVLAVNGTERVVPITLLVEGVLITGNLVSTHKYLNYVHAHLVETITQVNTENLHNIVLDMLVTNTSNGIRNREYRINDKVYFIHLENAVFHDGQQIRTPSPNGVFWRGALEKVAGFHLS